MPTFFKLDNLVVALPSYSSAGEMTSVSYPSGAGNGGNGTTLTLSRGLTGALSGVTSTVTSTGAVIASNTVTRSQSAKVIDEKVDGVDAFTQGDNFVYDAAGRLITARYRDTGGAAHTATYAFSSSGGCGASPSAGKNSNRTSITDGATTTNCYDSADRLTSSTDLKFTSPLYDSHGNTTSIGAVGSITTFTYDSSDRHLATTQGATGVGYGRDATDRIIERKLNGATVARYSYAGAGDTPEVTLNSSNAVIERTVGLPGGVILTKRASGDVYSYPNVHGDVIAVANSAGAKQGSTFHYAPYGEATSAPDNSQGKYDYGWLGQHQKGTDTEFTFPMVQMGARLYVPGLGRFLAVDPIEGGSANDYDYCFTDPVNCYDLDGQAAGDLWNKNLDCPYVGRVIGTFCEGYRSMSPTGQGVIAAVLTAAPVGVAIGCAAGGCAFIGAGIRTGAGRGIGFLRTLRFKAAIHPAHHTFKWFGKRRHIQVMLWRSGVKGSHRILRIPF